MRRALTLHPDSRCNAAIEIDVEAARPSPGELLLRYVVTGQVGALRMPAVTAPARGDGLWRHSCFEAFVRGPAGAAYYELNFAPSTEWAAYRFSGYRSEMTVASEVGAPQVAVQSDGARYELQAALVLDRLPGGEPWRLGLSAVIEETGGGQSYWALAHPAGRADFHHSDCFALELPAIERS